MKLTKEQVCVLIENEAHLQQAREVLERYGENVFHVSFFNKNEALMYDHSDGHWFMCNMEIFKKWEEKRVTQITLTELEQILKEEKDGL